MPGEEVPLYLSRLKSEAYPAALAPNEILLTADTVVVSDGEVLGKPLGREEAVQMLRRLSGRRHTVVSGVTLRTPGRTHTFAAKSSVWFRPLADEEIAYYLDACRPYDKAGSLRHPGVDRLRRPSKRSTARSTMSWGSRFRKYTPNSTNSSNK